MTVTTLTPHNPHHRPGYRSGGLPLRSAHGPVNVTIELALPLESASRELSETLEALRAVVQGIAGGTVRLGTSPPGRRRLGGVVSDRTADGGPPLVAPHPTPQPLPPPRSQPQPRPELRPDGVLLRIFPEERAVRLDRREIPLSRLEFDLLLFLADHPRQVFTRRQLLESVWGYTQASRRTVDVHVRRLRAKFAPLPLLATVRGVGYRLDAQSPVTVVRHRMAA